MPLAQANLLANETSPYLRQHKDNPVHWRAWSAASLAEAAGLDRPILLSVGYAACHWCHVMAHECFEDAEVADLMNRLYVNIKVDREERPDVDQIYMAALNATGEQGGWPLTMFLTPDAKPFWGGTYFPKHSRYGRPGFMQVLQSIDQAWRERRDELAGSGQALKDHVAARLSARHSATDHTARDQLPQLAEGIHSMIDQRLGGLRGAPKFPNAPFMQALWLNWLETGNGAHREAVILSLRKMLDGGIYDHAGGGLCRYSTDAEWLVPHFEKMLYDNAQLIRQAVWAHAETGSELFRDRIETTVAWLLREMRVEGGPFAASLDADSGGEEGAFYTWDRSEAESILGESEAATFFSAYELVAPPNWEGEPILRSSATQVSPAEAEHFKPMLAKLLDRRETRVRPGRDDKVLADWNGLTIAALAEASRAFGRRDWLDAAKAAYRFISESTDDAGRLPHSILGDRRLYPAMSSDYAAMANAAIALYEATADRALADDAVRFLNLLDRWYLDEDGAGHYLTASDSTDIPIRIRGDVDEATPSATSQIIEAFARAATATNRIDFLERAWTIARAATGRIAGQAYGQAGIVNACTMLEGARKLVIVEGDAHGLSQTALAHPDPRRVDLVLPLGAEPVELPGDVMLDTSRPAAWLCIGQACLPPIGDVVELKEALRKRSP